MSNTIIICGYGPGISDAVANKFGSEGFQLALVARNGEKLERARGKLEAQGVRVGAFPTDLSDPKAAKDLVQQVRGKFGTVSAIHWNAYANTAGDLMAADAAAIRTVLDVSVTSLVATVQEAHADLKTTKGALLVTNGGLAFFDPKVDTMALQWKAMGAAIANAAKHKLVGLLTEMLRADQITVGEVVVLGMVKGTGWDQENATVEPAAVAGKFWEIYSKGGIQSRYHRVMPPAQARASDQWPANQEVTRST